MSDHTGGLSDGQGPEDLKAAAKNLEAIQRAIIQHNGNCGFEILAIEMCQFELDRLGWDEFRGIPFRVNEKLPKRAFNLVCDGQHGPVSEVEDAEAVSLEDEPGVGVPAPGELVPVGA